MRPLVRRVQRGQRRRRDEGGFASLFSTALVVVVGLVALGVAVLGSALEARHRAAAAADLAAIAAAQAAQRHLDPCQAASLVAAANGGSLMQCRRDEQVVLVEVRATAAAVLGLRAVPHVVQAARAGPLVVGQEG